MRAENVLMGKRYSFVRFWLLRDQRVLMLLSVFLLSGSLFDTANAKSCDAVIGLLENNPHLILIKKPEGKHTTEYNSGSVTTLSVSCSLGHPDIAITWDGPTPDNAFYDLVGTAGNLLTHRPASEVVKYSKQCRQEALKDDSEIATIEREDMAIECQAFKRDGGGTTITIFTE